MKLMRKDVFIFNNVGISTQLWPRTFSNLHSHEFYEISYVLAGKISHAMNGERDDLEVGDLRLFTTDDKHELKSNGNDAIHRDIFVDKELFERFCETAFGSRDFFKNRERQNKAKLTHEELTELETLMSKFTSESVTEIKRCYGIEAVIKILNKILASQSDSQNLSFDDYPKTLKEIIDHFNKPFALKMSVSDIIARTGYNPSYISRLFKKYTGDNLSEYLKNLRLKHVAYYLKTTDLSLREIADIVGIESLSYLNSIFKKKYFVPPIQYRKENRSSDDNK